MPKHLYVGIDGGATKCTTLIQDASGQLIGRATTPSANIRLSVPQAWLSIQQALATILAPHAIKLGDPAYQFHVGMGLAGSELPEAYQVFTSHPHSFHTLQVASDAHTACLGAHAGKDGAIIIAGTGAIGYQIQEGKSHRVSGYGFPHDDQGSGATIGLAAAQLTLQAMDGRLASSALTEAVYAHFNRDKANFVTWLNQANSTAFATLAPIVVEKCQQGDEQAQQLMREAAAAIDKINVALLGAQKCETSPLPCTLMGGIAPHLSSYVGKVLQSRLQAPQYSAEEGAIMLVKQHLAKKGIKHE